MRFKHIIITAAMAVLFGVVVAGCSGSATNKTATQAPPVLPVTENPIKNTSVLAGLAITNAAVENNVDPATKKAISDRLQVSFKNGSTATMSGFEIYYKMTDVKTKKTEAYYLKLTGLTLNPGETKTIDFNNGHGAGQYPENIYSLYRTSKNEVTFDIEVSAAGFKLATAQATKSVGTSEKQD